MIIIIPLVCFAAFCLLWPTFTADKDPNRRIHREQQRALKRHNRMMKRA